VGPPARRDATAGSAPATKGGALTVGRPGKGPPSPTAPHRHPLDPDPWLCGKLDELHASVRDAHSCRAEGRTPGPDTHETDGAEARGVLATLARVWIDWLVEAAGNGDPAARAHLQDLGFGCFGREADAGDPQ
jgi:hypothetical protein